MVTVLDTERLPAADRRPARLTALLEATLSSQVRFPGERTPGRARLDVWAIGGLPVLRADVTAEVALTRSDRAVRDAEPTLSLAVQEAGTARQDHLGGQRLVPRGGLALTEVASPYAYRWSGHGVCGALQVPVSRLGLPVDAVRRAVPLAHLSPLYGLVRAHLAQVTRDADRWAPEVAGPLAAATVDLTRALLASAAGPAPGVADVRAETMLTQVRSYVHQHLTDPDLDAGQIAGALAISVRQLYRVCAAAELSLEQWIIDQRLHGARSELVDPGSRHRSIAAVARRWGFTDPSYFSRRFRGSFGLTPREWRNAAPPAPVPSPRRDSDDGVRRTHVRLP